jgi:chromosome segregation ATPase
MRQWWYCCWFSKAVATLVKRSMQLVVITGCAMLLLFPAPVLAAPAPDDAISTATQEFLQSVSQARTAFEQFSRESQDLLSQGIRESQQLLQQLPAELEQFAAETDVATRDELRQAIVDNQQSLEQLTASFDAQISAAEQADKQYKTAIDSTYDSFKKSISAAQAELKSATHAKIADLKQTLKETSKAIEGLSSGTTRIATGKVPFTPGQFDQQISALDAVFEKASSVIQSLSQ